MTSLTGSTKLSEPVPPPVPFPVALGGAVLQLTTVICSWAAYTSAGPCLTDPIPCILDLASADPWGRQALGTFCIGLATWALSVVLGLAHGGSTSDPSLVDRMWSVLPFLYVWHLLLSAPDPLAKPRLLAMAFLSTAWGCRLTYNFWIKGGFSGGEDYRWEQVRAWFPAGWRFETFNLVFICLFQHVTLLGFVSAAAIALQSETPWNNIDSTAACLFALLLLGEATADRQMWAFQTEKYRRIKAGEAAGPYAKGFIDTGLWGWSRHPNYFCEVSMWWAFYLFSVGAAQGVPPPDPSSSTSTWFSQLTWRSAVGQSLAVGGATPWLNWSALGPLFLTLLFAAPGASLDVTEALSSRKYPAYAAYQARVPRFVPWPVGRCLDLFLLEPWRSRDSGDSRGVKEN